MTDKRPEYLTLQEAAAQLRVCDETMRRLLRANQMQGTKVGRQWRILASEMQRGTTQGDSANDR